ncbi:type VI lipase adapter Tla3 domain-containing protein [Massilia genomosp. 1]|uniref:DUF2875 domain-containing protein n=1 Tax=Massilia genomosp. 1 TaxID=2609280 RepID=A0ABX0MPG1_9BURK|nr:DUF2875 family protein [Massilia genomosp. 1]NHZ61264.1 DUF2875 domain-containing protein [Massilia genomosp. 1]
MSRTAPPPLARRAPRAWALAALLAAPAWGAAPTLINKMDPLMSQTQTGSTFPPIASLELVGVGVAVETWRNHPDYPKAKLWQAVQDSNGSYIVSQDPKHYPKTLPEWQMMASKRNLDTIDAAVREFMDRYRLPISVVAPSFGEPDEGPARELSRKSNAHSVVVTTVGGPYTAPGSFRELLTQSGQVLNSYLNDEPDALWQTLFATFEQNADVPAIGVAAKDSAMHRALSFKRSDPPRYEKLAAEQVYRPKQARVVSDSFAMLVLAQRSRVERLRPFAPFVSDTMVVKNRGGRFSRNWSEFAGWKKNPPTPFVPTPFLAKPWTAFQVAQFDHLEHFGTVHRPLVVSYLDDAGKPVKALEKAARMQSALRAALAPLGGKPPARIFYDYGSVWDDRRGGERFVPLVQGLHAIDDDIDLLDPKRGFDLARILGDTGAASSFVGVALASMAGRQSGGATLVANLRRNDGATLLLVTPPSAEQITNDAAVKRPYFPSTAGVKDTF